MLLPKPKLIAYKNTTKLKLLDSLLQEICCLDITDEGNEICLISNKLAPYFFSFLGKILVLTTKVFLSFERILLLKDLVV